MVAQTIPVDRFDLTIFGATGDLARRKILPGLYRRLRAGQFDTSSRIIGASRTGYDTEGFRDDIKESLRAHLDPAVWDEDDVAQFLSCLHYVPLDIFTDDGWTVLSNLQRDDVVRAFYFSVGPSLFGEIARRLTQHKMTTADSRIVVEKPFGRDLETARALNAELRACFAEDQIYRIDHYLGKETVQNLMAVRFGNALFEPLWNAQHIDHIQITAAEDLGVDGRGEYYDKSGAMRDMVQNHIMQLLCLTAMEPPSHYDADSVRDEKLKVINALKPVLKGDVVRGQYRARGDKPSYLEHVDNPSSTTESFLAMKVEIANWRWSGVPIYLRTGKRLRNRLSEIAIVFKDPPHSIFDVQEDRKGNLLAIRLQPDEGMTLRVTIKEPGPGGMRLTEVPLDMTFAEALNQQEETPDAYERLIMDVIRGNQTLFMRGDEVEAAWDWVDPILKGWETRGDQPQQYDSFGSGPEDALMLLHRDGRKWRDIV
ncbi:glucose-6-phosphate 1-dehydrogenase [Amylibacter marinus]|uniref:Glucose-6-phosphate 1-dehydrogenase n=1 Tax=Amylibacter marinus TaxID=1475483 RepID=A0ABQ5VTE1_9RHOB|nr:glucose-6-phosphate dehydrogenase [Amylibacter marinus]GLQ34427.1 glucose-6-phosphate 1-dehydrogenase [Amylibacter marinus]